MAENDDSPWSPGQATKENLAFWSRVATSHTRMGPHVTSDEMRVQSTGKRVDLRDTAMAPYRPRGGKG